MRAFAIPERSNRAIFKFLYDYFALVVLACIVLAFAAGAIVHHSVVSGLLAGAAVVVAVVLIFTVMGFADAFAGRVREIRELASETRIPLPKALFLAWAWGLVSWEPPHSMMTPYLMVWAAIMAAGLYFLPRLPAWSHQELVVAAAIAVVAAGVINASFQRHGD